MTTELVVLPPADYANAVAERVARAMTRAISDRGAFALVLAGGSTPEPVYRALAARDDLPWASVTLLFGDERCVPPDHRDSNYRSAQQALFGSGPAMAARVVRMRGEAVDHSAAAAEYERLLPDRFDLVLLGVGEDGHTASLFAGSPAFDELERRVVPVNGPKPPPERLTLTPHALAATGSTFVLAAGASKANAVRRALTGGDVRQCPARIALGGTWFLDVAAASALADVMPVSGEAQQNMERKP
jgi:6-phosphogluconolactonase